MLIQLLGVKFQVINDTETLFEQARGETNTFDELCSALRKKLAQREYVQEQDAKTGSHIHSTQIKQIDNHHASPGWVTEQRAITNNTTYDDSG